MSVIAVGCVGVIRIVSHKGSRDMKGKETRKSGKVRGTL